jgi:hypothetical protein
MQAHPLRAAAAAPPAGAEPRIRDIYGRIELVQGLAHYVTSTLYFRTCLSVSIVLGRVIGGPFPLAKAINDELTFPR